MSPDRLDLILKVESDYYIAIPDPDKAEAELNAIDHRDATLLMSVSYLAPGWPAAGDGTPTNSGERGRHPDRAKRAQSNEQHPSAIRLVSKDLPTARPWEVFRYADTVRPMRTGNGL